MKFIRSGENLNLTFSWRERFVLFFRGKIVMDPKGAKTFVNLFGIISTDVLTRQPEELKNQLNTLDDKIETK